MSDKPVLTPGPDHPITITPCPSRVIVKAGGAVIVDTLAALTLQESTYPPVLYVPIRDADMEALVRTEHETYCQYKGDASYYSVPSSDGSGENAAWTYEAPFEAVAAIKEHLAFYPDRVDSIEQETISGVGAL